MALSNEGNSLILNLIQQLHSTAFESQDVQNDQAARSSLLNLCRQLTAQLETPSEVAATLAYSGTRATAVRIAIDLKIFDSLSLKSPQSPADLASVTGAEEALVRRILRPLSKTGYVNQINDESYTSTALGEHMLIPSVRAGTAFFLDQGPPILCKAPVYFQNNGGRLPQEVEEGLFQSVYDTEEQPYAYWAKQPGVMENFNVFMNGRWGHRTESKWSDWFPLREALLDGIDATKSEYTFVDVGGGKGHEGARILDRYPETKGRFILQDFPEAMKLEDGKELNARIERFAHDFNLPQPIKGARVYFLKSICHNWPDAVCRRILSQLRDVMIPGYSRIYIVDWVLKSDDVPLRISDLDLWMLFSHSGAERNVREWSLLVESVGLKIAKFWFPPGIGDGVVEVYLPL